MEMEILAADLQNPAHIAAIIEIIDSYAQGPGGQNAPISQQARENMGEGLRKYANIEVLLAKENETFVGIAVCKWGFSTFAGKPYLNIHDLAVLPTHRGKGIGRTLMHEAEERAKAAGCAKLTLEVHDSNEGAKRLYASEGYGPWESPTLFVSKAL
ncbi:MAG: GNAT family N-acetyltransferase [Bacteroidota bacterium]